MNSAVCFDDGYEDDSAEVVGGGWWAAVVNMEEELNSKTKNSDFEASQWVLVAPDMFAASGTSHSFLPAGIYRVLADQAGRILITRHPLVTDKLEVLPDSFSERVVEGIRVFWDSKPKYEKYGLAYKRGVLFFGVPGAGKTSGINLLCKELIEKHNGIVIMMSNPDLTTSALHIIRKIEPDRPLIVVMEDLDEIIRKSGEHEVLSLLDGENQISNVVFLASTNYIDLLGPRIINRPARFDERVEVHLPSPITRKAYLKATSGIEPLTDEELDTWTADTEGFSISHLRELFIAVKCLGRDYEDTMARLRSMGQRPKEHDGMEKSTGVGLISNKTPRKAAGW